MVENVTKKEIENFYTTVKPNGDLKRFQYKMTRGSKFFIANSDLTKQYIILDMHKKVKGKKMYAIYTVAEFEDKETRDGNWKNWYLDEYDLRYIEFRKKY